MGDVVQLREAVAGLAGEVGEVRCACAEVGNYFVSLYGPKATAEMSAELGVAVQPGELLVDGYCTDFVCDDRVDLFVWDGAQLREIVR